MLHGAYPLDSKCIVVPNSKFPGLHYIHEDSTVTGLGFPDVKTGWGFQSLRASQGYLTTFHPRPLHLLTAMKWGVIWIVGHGNLVVSTAWHLRAARAIWSTCSKLLRKPWQKWDPTTKSAMELSWGPWRSKGSCRGMLTVTFLFQDPSPCHSSKREVEGALYWRK